MVSRDNKGWWYCGVATCGWVNKDEPPPPTHKQLEAALEENKKLREALDAGELLERKQTADATRDLNRIIKLKGDVAAAKIVAAKALSDQEATRVAKNGYRDEMQRYAQLCDVADKRRDTMQRELRGSEDARMRQRRTLAHLQAKYNTNKEELIQVRDINNANWQAKSKAEAEVEQKDQQITDLESDLRLTTDNRDNAEDETRTELANVTADQATLLKALEILRADCRALREALEKDGWSVEFINEGVRRTLLTKRHDLTAYPELTIEALRTEVEQLKEAIKHAISFEDFEGEENLFEALADFAQCAVIYEGDRDNLSAEVEQLKAAIKGAIKFDDSKSDGTLLSDFAVFAEAAQANHTEASRRRDLAHSPAKVWDQAFDDFESRATALHAGATLLGPFNPYRAMADVEGCDVHGILFRKGSECSSCVAHERSDFARSLAASRKMLNGVTDELIETKAHLATFTDACPDCKHHGIRCLQCSVALDVEADISRVWLGKMKEICAELMNSNQCCGYCPVCRNEALGEHNTGCPIDNPTKKDPT
jgi:hypothetical protein